MAYRKTDRELDRLRQRRESIVAAASSVVQRAGFGGAKARETAEAAGVSVGSLYSNFDGIDGLHVEVFRSLAERELRRVAHDVDDAARPRDALVALVQGFGARCLAAPMVAWALLLEPVSPAIETLRLRYRRDYADLVASVIRDGISTGEFGFQAVEISAPAIVGAIAESLVRPLDPFVRNDFTGDTDAVPIGAGLIDEIAQFCLRAVGAEPAQTGPTTPGRP
ncbi:TetR/AcrR family transcriptional regulator [Stackebrandtia soli]|uniref:TetR/AcrR family transcriptional regulator n=1 Tax=Stackebrandtia soli TaxID=1892856 RepID=UPI0039E9D6C3